MRLQLQNVRIFDKTGIRRVETIEDIKKFPTIIVVGESKGKTICMEGVYKWNTFREYYWKSGKNGYKFVSLAQRESLIYNEIHEFSFSHALYDDGFGSMNIEIWPELLAAARNNSKGKFFVVGKDTKNSDSIEGNMRLTSFDIKEDGILHDGIFYRIVKN